MKETYKAFPRALVLTKKELTEIAKKAVDGFVRCEIDYFDGSIDWETKSNLLPYKIYESLAEELGVAVICNISCTVSEDIVVIYEDQKTEAHHET